MRFSNSLLSILAVTSTVSNFAYASSFKNTAPSFVLTDNEDYEVFNSIDEPTKFDSYSNLIKNIICFAKESCDLNDNTSLLKIEGLDNSILNNKEFIDLFSSRYIQMISDNIIYTKTHASEVISTESDNCDFATVFTVNANDADFINELEKISELTHGQNVIVQGIPTFQDPLNDESYLSQAKHKINYYLNSQKKRDNKLNYDTIEEDLKESMDEVNELLNSEYNLNDDEDDYFTDFTASSAVPTNKGQNIQGSLFDKYGFFSTGIWMGTIVFLSLTWLLYIALTWLNSMQISYGAFEKPVDFNKKLQ